MDEFANSNLVSWPAIIAAGNVNLGKKKVA
jgi:hypothetical protein